MLNLVGVYECKLDAKGRFAFPSPMKKQMGSFLSEGFVLKRSVFQPCLELYPVCEWEVLMKKVNKLNRFVKKNNDFIRRFTAGVKKVEIDTSGRLLLPKDLLTYAEVSKDIVLSSMVNVLEIWDKEKYEQVLAEAQADFSDLAEEVMGEMIDE